MKIFNDSFAGVATSATRVIELYYPEDKRLFDDPFALNLLPLGWQVLFRLLFLPGLRDVILSLRERRMPGSLGAILCRTRYIDDILRRSLEQGLDQVVILGAGFDSRAYRIAGMDKAQVFEVDLPGTRKLKKARLEKVLGAVPKNVTLIGLDFDQQVLADSLSAAGFQAGERTLFIWEGVTQYITAEAVEHTLKFVSSVSGVGTALVFTYVRKGLIDGTDRPDWFEPFLSFARRVGSPLIFGLDQDVLEQYLSGRGLRLIEDVGAADFQEQYLKPLGRELRVFDGSASHLPRSRVDCLPDQFDIDYSRRYFLNERDAGSNFILVEGLTGSTSRSGRTSIHINCNFVTAQFVRRYAKGASTNPQWWIMGIKPEKSRCRRIG